MSKFLSLGTLIWIDAGAAFASGFSMILLKSLLYPLFQLPENLLTTLASISFAYSAFSFSLALRKTLPRKLLLVLIAANSLYSITCLGLLIYFSSTATFFGSAYLFAEFFCVAVLAFLERGKLNEAR